MPEIKVIKQLVHTVEGGPFKRFAVVRIGSQHQRYSFRTWFESRSAAEANAVEMQKSHPGVYAVIEIQTMVGKKEGIAARLENITFNAVENVMARRESSGLQSFAETNG